MFVFEQTLPRQGLLCMHKAFAQSNCFTTPILMVEGQQCDVACAAFRACSLSPCLWMGRHCSWGQMA